MNDEEIEALLQRYRPVTRLPDYQTTRFPRTWPWAVAAAALLSITVGLHTAEVPAPDASPFVDPQRVLAIAEALGGTPQSQVMAEWIVRREARVEEEARVARLAVRGIEHE